MEKGNTNNGITLIALIITIILMLILASITINVAIDGGLFNYAKKAIDSTEIASEKETLQKATIMAESTSKTGRVTVKELQKVINNIAEENKATAMDDGDIIVVKFNESNRYYKINSKGTVEGPIEIIKDTTPGELDGTGTKEDPFLIMSIEDLVYFSQTVANGNGYVGQYIELGKTLDFKSDLSYVDPTTTEYDEYLGGDGTAELKKQLCEGGNGFVRIGGNTGYKKFWGEFNGNGYEIKNIYSNSLFGHVSSAVIKNIKVSGHNVGEKSSAGIIYSATNSYVYNCCSNIEIKGITVGGICNSSLGSKFINCYNIAKISGKWQFHAGGIVGSCDGDTEIFNTYNLADVEMVNGNASACAGGIVGRISAGTIKIANSYNIGKITSSKHSGSLVALYASEDVQVDNSYYLEGTAVSTVGTQVTKEQMKNEQLIDNEYIIDRLNDDVDNYNAENKNVTDFIELKRWEIDENGYAGFVDNE